jgi:hypothetical protein
MTPPAPQVVDRFSAVPVDEFDLGERSVTAGGIRRRREFTFGNPSQDPATDRVQPIIVGRRDDEVARSPPVSGIPDHIAAARAEDLLVQRTEHAASLRK